MRPRLNVWPNCRRYVWYKNIGAHHQKKKTWLLSSLIFTASVHQPELMRQWNWRELVNSAKWQYILAQNLRRWRCRIPHFSMIINRKQTYKSTKEWLRQKEILEGARDQTWIRVNYLFDDRKTTQHSGCSYKLTYLFIAREEWENISWMCQADTPKQCFFGSYVEFFTSIH